MDDFQVDRMTESPFKEWNAGTLPRLQSFSLAVKPDAVRTAFNGFKNNGKLIERGADQDRDRQVEKGGAGGTVDAAVIGGDVRVAGARLPVMRGAGIAESGLRDTRKNRERAVDFEHRGVVEAPDCAACSVHAVRDNFSCVHCFPRGHRKHAMEVS